MFCSHCGKQIPDNAGFCSYCGNRIIGKGDEEVMGAPKNEGRCHLPGFLKLKRTWICIAVFFISVGALIIFRPFYSDNNDEAPVLYATYKKGIGPYKGCDLFIKNSAINGDARRINVPEGIDSSRFPVLITDDRKTIYCFNAQNDDDRSQRNKLYKINVPDSSASNAVPVVVDENVSAEFDSPVIMKDGSLIYSTYDEKTDNYILKRYDGNITNKLIEMKKDRQPKTFTDKNKNVIYVRIRSENDEFDSWYRIEVGKNPRAEFVCNDYTLHYGSSDTGIQSMIDSDSIICRESGAETREYDQIKLYSQGTFEKVLIEELPTKSYGPFEISVKKDICSFHLISTIDWTSSIRDERKEWSMFRYENGSITELNEELRSYGGSAFDAMDARGLRLSDLYSLNNEVIARYNDGLYSFVPGKEKKQIINANVLWKKTDVKGHELLLLEDKDCLYAYSQGLLKKLTENKIHWYLFKRDEDICMIGLEDFYMTYFYSLNLGDIDFESVESQLKRKYTRNLITGIYPYSNNKVLYLNNNSMILWDDGRETLINDEVYTKSYTDNNDIVRSVIATDWN